MARGHVRDLMRHHRGDLGRVVGEREQPAGHEDVARGQSEGVDDRRIEQRDPIGLVGGVGRLRQLDEDAVQIALGRGRVIFAAEGVDEPLALRAGGAA